MKVLNAGSGEPSQQSLHPVFQSDRWQEVRLDIDPLARPDRLGSITDLDRLFEPGSFNAVWSSHSLEHLHSHEIEPALIAMRRVLRRDGFALIRCPDLEAVAGAILDKGLEDELYRSPAGSITALDILFGHSTSIASGNSFMAHHTGFTTARLGNALMRAGFTTIAILQFDWDLWAAACLDMTDEQFVQRELQASGLDLSF